MPRTPFARLRYLTRQVRSLVPGVRYLLGLRPTPSRRWAGSSLAGVVGVATLRWMAVAERKEKILIRRSVDWYRMVGQRELIIRIVDWYRMVGLKRLQEKNSSCRWAGSSLAGVVGAATWRSVAVAERMGGGNRLLEVSIGIGWLS